MSLTSKIEFSSRGKSTLRQNQTSTSNGSTNPATESSDAKRNSPKTMRLRIEIPPPQSHQAPSPSSTNAPPIRQPPFSHPKNAASTSGLTPPSSHPSQHKATSPS